MGDGVYAIHPGYQIELRANDLEQPTDIVYLDSSVLEALNRFNQTVTKAVEENE